MKLLKFKNIVIASVCLLSFAAGGFVSGKADEDKLTSGIIKEAQKLFGLHFTDAEADSMLDNLATRRNNYAELRKLDIPNSVSPALNFNPMPAGYEFPDTSNYFMSVAMAPSTVPVNRDELAWYSVGQLAILIKSGKITSTELTRFFIDRLKRYNGVLLNTVTFTEERAMASAKKADAEIKAGKYRGKLHGIPFGVKDLLAVRGYRTTWGSVPFKEQVIDTDATVVKKLEDAGAVLIAKLTLGELAMGDVWFGGKTKNPWDIQRGSSGSSAGAASAVAAGCLPFAIGSETLGSIVSPSTECGTTGLRPTFGRVSKYGAMALSWSMDKLGPITRSVEDCALVFNVIRGADKKDLSVIPAPFRYQSPSAGKGLKGYRIGYLKTDFDRRYGNHGNDSATLAKLKEMGAELVPLELPKMPYGDMLIVLYSEAGAAFSDLTLSDRDDLMVMQNKGAWPNTFRSARFIPAVEYIQANRARAMLIAQLHEKLKGLDLYISPTSGQNLLATNLSGHPCVVLPNGLNRNGLPASITFMGQLFGEGKMLEAAQAYQAATGFNKKHPALNF